MADARDDAALEAIAQALDGCPSGAFKAGLRRRLERSIDMVSMANVDPAVHGVRPGFTAVTPYLWSADIEPVIAFAKAAFGAEETHRATGSAGGLHCELRIGDAMLMLGGGASTGAGGRPLTPRLMGLHVYVDDVDATFRRALDAGAVSLGAPADRPYGERSGFVRDPAGNHWYIATPLGASYFAEPPRTVTPHLYMQRTPGGDATGAPAFLEFLRAAFGAEVELRHDAPDGLVVHAVARLQGAAIELGEGRDPQFAHPAALYLYVPDCDAWYARALGTGAKSLYPPTDLPYGDRMGGVEDAWGNEWFIATHGAART